ncbi:hypothetical protein PVAND_006571 [Polypedilum vanderplanki]|uniref:TATA element modulatory factor 1 TATA binding domain-containing protein n=1 Tax=Polypedilum vanderplanki TaxID=319348 RepID=A0A9J6C427_POLVA|nr:hypothetical protein PVAND_006571 [Polypedilum vanderplanki]
MWFDSSSIANLAKNALKEAQRHIDNVLDIKEEDLLDTATTKSDGNDDNEKNQISKSKTMPEIAVVNKEKNDNEESVWGSFNGSFFESSNSVSNQATITNAPLRKEPLTSSESLEILSNKTVSTSDIRSSSQSTLQGSAEESVEIITPSSCNITNPDILSPDNIESDFSENALTPDEMPSIPITVAPTRSVNSQELDINSSVTTVISTSTLTNSGSESFYDPSKDDFDQSSLKAVNTMEKSMESFEIQTNISDSTHSFEEIHLKLKNNPSNDVGKRSSGHTSSGDELETATSSDIEIISSPNGDSSSTAASCLALSPQKSCQVATFPYQNSESFLSNLQLDQQQHHFKGHSRELSEVSVLSINDESSSPVEIERLLKRISELSENLEQREMQLIQIGKINAEMNQELESLKLGRNNIDMSNIQEEHTQHIQRLSALEKKFQQSIRENSVLKNRLETLKVEAESKVSSHEYEKMKNENELVIETLKQEGEKLSKQILQHSTAIKKLKVKLKENDEVIKRQDNIIAELTEENIKLKKNLIAKDEIEKSQLEGINKLTIEKRKFEKECHTLISQNEDLQQKLLAIQSSYDAIKKELNDKSRELGKNLEEEKEKALSESKLLRKELNDLREVNRCNEQAASCQLQKLRQENLELKKKLELAEFRIEDQKQQASLASIPLIKQFESLQNTLNVRTAQWENQERILLRKLDEAQNRLDSQSDVEKITKDQVSHLNMKISNLEERLSQTSLKLEQTIGQLQQKEIECNLHDNDLSLKIEQLSLELSTRTNECEKFKNLLDQAEEKIRLERNAFEEEKKKLLFVQQQNQIHHQPVERRDSHENELIVNDSPVPSLVGSIESLSHHPWNIDDQDVGANSTYSSQYGGIVNSSASLMEGLQSILKQRDGELQQLQWEIHRLQTERNFLSNEMSQLTAELEKATEHIREITEKQQKQEEMQIQYDALLEMYGQKVEEYEELKLDLVDLKSISQMYKTQIDELTLKLNNKSVSEI